MKLFTCYSPSHRKFFDKYLRPTANGFDEIIPTLLEQQGNGEIHNPGWFPSMRAKAHVMAQAAESCKDGEIFVYSDSDVIFLGDGDHAAWLKECLGDSHLAAQKEAKSDLCAGFVVARATPLTRQLFRGMSEVDDDQGYLNYNRGMVQWRFLPEEEVWTLGRLDTELREHLQKDLDWQETLRPHIPREMKVFHANYLTNIDSKLAVLEYVKTLLDTTVDVKVLAVMSVPRYGATESRGIMERSLRANGITLATYGGVFYGQCMQRGFNEALKQECDWVLTLDYDTLVSPDQLKRFLEVFANRKDIDALAALQARRANDKPLLTSGREKSIVIQRDQPVKVTTAHFGLTLIRLDRLKDLPKPWFWSEPNKDGEWEDDRLDDDIYFWHIWRKAGRNVWVDPSCRIGHMEEMTSYYDENLDYRMCPVKDWREKFCT